jgi:cytochrome c biogenesis protein CcmG, thiol:disulfide interchange protein DsbE
MKRALMLLGAVALVVVLVIGLTQAGGTDAPENEQGSFDLAKAKQQLAGAPAPLAALHEQSNELLEGGTGAFRARLRELRGHPVVINKWASWCGPCRGEFPVFQRVATERGKEIAFLGVNSGDSTQPARDFLASYPVPFPSYLDPDERIARAIKAPANYPITVFLDARGKTAFIHQGPYDSTRALEADLDRYLAA